MFLDVSSRCLHLRSQEIPDPPTVMKRRLMALTRAD